MSPVRFLLPLLLVWLIEPAVRTTTPAAGSIRGRVAVPAVPSALARPVVMDPSTHGPVNRRRVVVYLESAPREAFGELSPGRARMDQRDEQFVPRVLAIT